MFRIFSNDPWPQWQLPSSAGPWWDGLWADIWHMIKLGLRYGWSGILAGGIFGWLYDPNYLWVWATAGGILGNLVAYNVVKTIEDIRIALGWVNLMGHVRRKPRE